MNGQPKKGLMGKAEEKKKPAPSLWISTVCEMEGGGLEKHPAEIL